MKKKYFCSFFFGLLFGYFIFLRTFLKEIDINRYLSLFDENKRTYKKNKNNVFL